jgi:putative transposase
METAFCVRALKKALALYDQPEIFNTDQGSQFTSCDFTGVLKDCDIKISMDGKGRWRDNIFIERLWRSLKYECVYLSAFETGSKARAGIGRWIDFYNHRRTHSAHGVRTPAEAYAQSLTLQKGCENVEENYAMAA